METITFTRYSLHRTMEVHPMHRLVVAPANIRVVRPDTSGGAIIRNQRVSPPPDDVPAHLVVKPQVMNPHSVRRAPGTSKKTPKSRKPVGGEEGGDGRCSIARERKPTTKGDETQMPPFDDPHLRWSPGNKTSAFPRGRKNSCEPKSQAPPIIHSAWTVRGAGVVETRNMSYLYTRRNQLCSMG